MNYRAKLPPFFVVPSNPGKPPPHGDSTVPGFSSPQMHLSCQN